MPIKDPEKRKEYDRQRGRARAARIEGREERLARQREANARQRAKRRDYARANRGKFNAHQAVDYALKMGRLHKEPCLFCGSAAVEAHHHDYSLPLAVTWLCRSHHRLIHRSVRR